MSLALRLSSRANSPGIRRRFLHPSTPLSRGAGTTFARRPGVLLTSLGVVGGSLYFLNSIAHADLDMEEHVRSRRPTSLSTLLRSYIVYTMCSIPVLVDCSPTILATLSSVPGLKQVTEAVVRSTFFAQFVGGDSVEDTVPLMMELRKDNKGVLLAYSVEVDQDEAEGKTKAHSNMNSAASHKYNVEETIRCIDVAAKFEDLQSRNGTSKSDRKTWVAVKLTALVPSAQSLIALSDHIRQTRPQCSPQIPFPGCPHPSDLDFIESGSPSPENLSEEDVAILKDLYHDLYRIAERGSLGGVRIVVDAEYSWYQPAIDAFTLSLMRRFNKEQYSEDKSARPVQPLIYASYQAYLKRTPSHLLQSLRDAKAEGYSIGIKLVRGAYHPFEVNASSSPDTCPVWSEKRETDACYDQCVALLLSALREDIAYEVPRLGILFGTHNSQSCQRVLDGLVREGIAEINNGLIIMGDAITERCAIGQLFGMSDTLTNSLVDRINSPSPFVIKYVPYGPLSDVMPYLSRRAIENKSVLSGEGGAVSERRRIGAEIRKRLWGF